MNKYKNNVDYLLTTHYIEMCEKFKKNKYIKNRRMKVNKTENNIEYLYKIEDGISNVNGGYQVLVDLKYSEDLLNK